MKKHIKNGKVAVLVSGGFGAGWSTWNGELGTQAIFDVDMVQALLDGQPVLPIAEKKYPDAYHGGVEDLRVEWVPVGERFEIDEYDGSESLRIFSKDDGMEA